MPTATFTPGKTYTARFIGDYDSTVDFTIISRTDKTITTNIYGKPARLKIFVWDDSEYFYPYGRCSMALTCYAKKLKK